MRNVEYEVSKQFRDIMWEEVRRSVDSYKYSTLSKIRLLQVADLIWHLNDSVREQCEGVQQ